jgi:hypothetical protein
VAQGHERNIAPVSPHVSSGVDDGEPIREGEAESTNVPAHVGAANDRALKREGWGLGRRSQ